MWLVLKLNLVSVCVRGLRPSSSAPACPAPAPRRTTAASAPCAAQSERGLCPWGLLSPARDGSQRSLSHPPGPGWAGSSPGHLHPLHAHPGPPALPTPAHRPLPGKLLEREGSPLDGLHGPARHGDVTGFARVHHRVIHAAGAGVPVVMETGKGIHR